MLSYLLGLKRYLTMLCKSRKVISKTTLTQQLFVSYISFYTYKAKQYLTMVTAVAFDNSGKTCVLRKEEPLLYFTLCPECVGGI